VTRRGTGHVSVVSDAVEVLDNVVSFAVTRQCVEVGERWNAVLKL